MLNSQSKIYTFNGTEFQTERNVLKVQNAWLPLAIYFDEILKMYTEGLESKELDGYKVRLTDITAKDKQDQSDLKKLQSEETPNVELIERINNQIEKNKSELDKINSEYEWDETAKAQQDEYNKKLAYAFQFLVSSYEMIQGFLNVYLIGDKSKLDYEDSEIIPFVEKVITDFFLYKMQNKN